MLGGIAVPWLPRSIAWSPVVPRRSVAWSAGSTRWWLVNASS